MPKASNLINNLFKKKIVKETKIQKGEYARKKLLGCKNIFEIVE